MQPCKTLAGNLRRIRQMRGLTQEQAAELCGISTRHFQKLESGHVDPHLGLVFQIAGHLSLDVAELLSPSAWG